jgi:hypothetical protein
MKSETFGLEIEIRVLKPGAYSQAELACYKHEQSGIPDINSLRSLLDACLPAGEAHIRESLARLENEIHTKEDKERHKALADG